MANKIFDEISMEELNEMLNNMPNDFDTEKKVKRRIRNKTMQRINGQEASFKHYEILRAAVTIAAVCIMVLGVMWAVGFDNVSAYVKKTFFTPGVTEKKDTSDIWVETTTDEVIVHKTEDYIPLILAEPATGSNENAKLSIVNITSINRAIIDKSPEEYEDIEQYYIDQNGKYYNGIMLELQIELEDKVITELKKTYADDLHESGNSFLFDTEGANAISPFEGYNFSITANGKEYSEIGRNAELDHAYGSSSGLSEIADYHIGFDGWTFIIDAEDLNTDTVYTLNMDHKIFGKISVDFKLKEAAELGNAADHKTLSVMHDGVTITAVKYETEINGKKYIAVDTSVDDTAFPVEVVGGGINISSYYDEKTNTEILIGFEKSDGTIVGPTDWKNNTLYYDAELIDEGDDFVIPGVSVHDFNVVSEESAGLPIPEAGKVEKDDVVFEFGLGNLIIDRIEITEDFSAANTVIEGDGLLMNVKFEFAEELENMSVENIWAGRPQGELPEGQDTYYSVSGVDSWITTGYSYNEDEPYFIKIQENDKDSIPLSDITISAYMKQEFRFDF